MMDWLRRHEPQLAESVEPRLGDVEDFLRVQDFAYGAERVYSRDRWPLVGEAGAFADPFYSTDPTSSVLETSSRRISSPAISTARTSRSASSTTTTSTSAPSTCCFEGPRTYPAFGNVWVANHKLLWDPYFDHTGYVILTVRNKIAEALDQRPELDRAINPYAVSLRPERWEEDGLYEEPGLTAEQAREQALAAGPPPDMGPPGAGGPPGRGGPPVEGGLPRGMPVGPPEAGGGPLPAA